MPKTQHPGPVRGWPLEEQPAPSSWVGGAPCALHSSPGSRTNPSCPWQKPAQGSSASWGLSLPVSLVHASLSFLVSPPERTTCPQSLARGLFGETQFRTGVTDTFFQRLETTSSFSSHHPESSSSKRPLSLPDSVVKRRQASGTDSPQTLSCRPSAVPSKAWG